MDIARSSTYTYSSMYKCPDNNPPAEMHSTPSAVAGHTVLKVQGLRVQIASGSRQTIVVDDVSFRIGRGEVFGLVGESGSGKSMTALSVMGLLPRPQARVVGGQVEFEQEDLLRLPDRAVRRLRGSAVGMIFQEPMTSLNPVLTVGFQVGEALRVHGRAGKAGARRRAVELLRRVGIVDSEQVADDYPHRLSGGMRQRAMIAMAMACNPRLLIADEPTTALDVTIQAQVLDLIDDLRRETGAAVLLITHNFSVIAQKADRVAVMYAGAIVEEASAHQLLRAPLHPYTQGLLASIPRLGMRRGGSRPPRLPEIPGFLPGGADSKVGCAFAPRCHMRTPECTRVAPPLIQTSPGHLVRCPVNAPGLA